ncbi:MULTISPECIES: N-acetylglucosamine-6-phosphate deacetylase [Halocynthiibacter]|uniref:N-acetylglucosamine-6-phosphate deacetylase n=1 Tax=Halocynthiibacter halioticoli TaxID=2986804 RepID=A0AAE3LTA3_9RHOB|nr:MULTISPECIES: N-acetylglucosamine-6-phosphate deacetylase [Halocynthiibacter]MCV6824786.1 N-acetylglucosamine-6-phosphate deacetylase [Halocynthiibacter halioticoli]MCW4057787.1 N-acetylglucosamine-6-phosphate deacetylase [Halocynthiibacter sp. SDUM655004]
MERWITPDRLFDGQKLLSGASLRVKDGRIAEVREEGAPDTASETKVNGTVTPGFIDLQVNGGGDVMLNADPSRAGMQTIVAAHRKFGTVGILPTVITDRAEVVDQAVDAAIEAKGDQGILGLHIEGPHIAPVRRGTHLERFVRPMDERTMKAVAKLRHADIAVMITLAPDAVSCEDIAVLSDMGAVVSIGHTDATAEQIEAAIKAGARCATHLFNAMSPMVGRAPGAVGGVINSDLYSGIICDGYHVADAMVGLAIRARPTRGRMFLVSDAMATVGGSDHFSLYGDTIYLKDGRLVNAEGSLAGAHVTQAEGVKRLVEKVKIPLDQALQMATSVPAACMGLTDVGQLQGRNIEDVILLSEQLEYVGALDAQIAVQPSKHDA